MAKLDEITEGFYSLAPQIEDILTPCYVFKKEARFYVKFPNGKTNIISEDTDEGINPMLLDKINPKEYLKKLERYQDKIKGFRKFVESRLEKS